MPCNVESIVLNLCIQPNRAEGAMSQTAEPEDRDAFTCGALLMCLCLPGFSKKKKQEQQTGKTQQPTTTDEQVQSQPAEHAQEPDPQTQLESFSLYSGSNIVFDFLVEPGEGLQGYYCPSPCFDLPAAALIRAGERCGAVVAGSETPVASAALAFDGYRGDDAMRRMASCLPSGVPTGGVAEEPSAHLVRFLSASGSRPQVT